MNTEIQTICLKQYGTPRSAHRHAAKIEQKVKERWQGNVHVVVDVIDDGAVELQLVGKFGQDIILWDIL